jgi:hypothetical protein
MAKPLKVAGPPLFKPRTPKVPEALKYEISSKAQQLVEQHLKPAHVELPEDPQCNYIADIYTRWHERHFYFCATYIAFSPDAASRAVEVPFARMGYLGSGKFNLDYMGQTGKWCKMYPCLSIDKCLEAVREEPHFIP